MRIKINNKIYSCFKRVKNTDEVLFYTVKPAPDENLSGVIKLCRDDGFVLSEDKVDDYIRHEYVGSMLKLTNKPVPVPPEPKPDTRANAEKRKAAYTEGMVDGISWRIEYDEKLYTCDELTLLGSQYEFRGETDTAERIRELVVARVSEIREAYPPENNAEEEEKETPSEEV